MTLEQLIWAAPLIGFSLGAFVHAVTEAWELWTTRHIRKAREAELSRRIERGQERCRKLFEKIKDQQQ